MPSNDFCNTIRNVDTPSEIFEPRTWGPAKAGTRLPLQIVADVTGLRAGTWLLLRGPARRAEGTETEEPQCLSASVCRAPARRISSTLLSPKRARGPWKDPPLRIDQGPSESVLSAKSERFLVNRGAFHRQDLSCTEDRSSFHNRPASAVVLAALRLCLTWESLRLYNHSPKPPNWRQLPLAGFAIALDGRDGGERLDWGCPHRSVPTTSTTEEPRG